MERERKVDPQREQARELPSEERPLDPAQQTRGEQKTSTKKVEANRRNASKSTGPRTAAGKKVVAQNATKHGFFSNGLLVRHSDSNESQSEYDDLRDRVRKDFEPEAFAEEYWVEKIVVYLWRLRRVLRYESGQIALSLAEHRDTLEKKEPNETDDFGQRPTRGSELETRTDHLWLPAKEQSDIILRYEVMFNKQLNHAFAELEKIQSRRKRDFGHEPHRVEVGGRKD